MNPKIITLLSDFGIKDHYVAAMKGVILGISPEARLIDISHMAPPHDIRSGAYLLASVCDDFPSGAIHLAVIDPGVGTARRAIVIRARNRLFVGPDNGLFSWIVKEGSGWEAWSIENRKMMRGRVSSTFHGRDIFAPAAAYLAEGASPEDFGPPCVPLISEWSSARASEKGLFGEIIYIDHFGNIITNITAGDLEHYAQEHRFVVSVAKREIDAIVRAYGDCEIGALTALIGSSDRLEISVNQGNAAKLLDIRPGDQVSVHLRDLP